MDGNRFRCGEGVTTKKRRAQALIVCLLFGGGRENRGCHFAESMAVVRELQLQYARMATATHASPSNSPSGNPPVPRPNESPLHPTGKTKMDPTASAPPAAY